MNDKEVQRVGENLRQLSFHLTEAHYPEYIRNSICKGEAGRGAQERKGERSEWEGRENIPIQNNVPRTRARTFSKEEKKRNKI